MAGDPIGLLLMISGTVILSLAALYHFIPLMTTTDQGWWSAPPSLNSLLGKIFFLFGESFNWPGLTVGALLGILGILIWAWPRVRIPGMSGKGVKAMMLIGGLIILMGAIIGAIPVEMWGALAPAGEIPSTTAFGRYSFVYTTLVLTGMAIVLGAAAWASWKGWRWRRPTPAVSENGESVPIER